jgi:S-adenosylmethionine decarboxylase
LQECPRKPARAVGKTPIPCRSLGDITQIDDAQPESAAYRLESLRPQASSGHNAMTSETISLSSINDQIASPAKHLALRSWRERALQTLCFEVGGLVVASPIYSAFTGKGKEESILLVLILSIIVSLWAAFHNSVFDYIDIRLTGRIASDRPHKARIFQATSQELTSMLVTLPVIMVIGGHGFIEALTIDVGLTIIYTVYAYLFHMVYDHVRPVQTGIAASANTGQCRSKADLGTSDAATETFGVHIMIDGYDAPHHLLDSDDYLRKLLDWLPGAIGMTIISEPKIVRVGPMNKKDSGGISGFVMIAESHISFHTFPSRNFVTLDLYTCQGDIDRQKTVALLKRVFEIKDADVFIQDRGLRYPASDRVLNNA